MSKISSNFSSSSFIHLWSGSSTSFFGKGFIFSYHSCNVLLIIKGYCRVVQKSSRRTRFHSVPPRGGSNIGWRRVLWTQVDGQEHKGAPPPHHRSGIDHGLTSQFYT
jgi:hypothetical protein